MRLIGLAIPVLCGLVLIGIGWIRLRHWRRFTTGRQPVMAMVVAAGQRELSLRLSTGGARPVELTVEVGTQVAARWSALLRQGPPPLEEPDFEDPHGWDTVSIRYDPDGVPPAMLTERVESAKVGPTVLATLGVVTVIFAALAVVPSVLLGTIGLAQATVAALFGASALRLARRQPVPHGRRSVTAGVVACVGVALFLVVGATASLIAAFA